MPMLRCSAPEADRQAIPFRSLYSIAGVGKCWGMPTLEVTEPFGGSNEGIWENFHRFIVYYYFPDGTYIVTVSHGEITA